MKKILKKMFFVIIIISTIVFLIKILSLKSVGVDNSEVITETNLDKYINYDNITSKGTLVQYDIKSRIKYQENQQYVAVKDSEITVNLSKIDEKYPRDVKVIAKSMEVTNGKTNGIEENYYFDSTTGKLTIKASNDSLEIKQLSQNSNDEYIIICDYDTYTPNNNERNLTLGIYAKYEINNDEDSIISKDNQLGIKVTNNIGYLTSVNTQTEDIYNGYIKSNVINGTTYNTEYQETNEINISKKDMQDTIQLIQGNNFESQQENAKGEIISKDLGNNGNLFYKTTTVIKSEIDELLGEEGTIEILDENSNNIAIINRDTKFSEDGTYTILYPSDITGIIVKSSKIKNEGFLHIKNTKVISSNVIKFENIYVKTNNAIIGLSGTSKKYVYNNEKAIKINSAQNNISMDMNTKYLTNENQNEVNFDLYLNSTTSKDNLFDNPTIKIELPNEVEKVILKDNSILYANGLELQQPTIEQDEEGNISIVAKLTGKQQEYYENNLGITTHIKISATIILKKEINTTQKSINLLYSNHYNLTNTEEITKKNIIVEINAYEEKQEVQQDQNNQAQEDIKINSISNNRDQTNNISQQLSANLDALNLEVQPVKGDVNLQNNDVIYEGEYIKYNIKLTNASNENIDNVKIEGDVPEGVTYGELEADYFTFQGKYQYNFDTSLRKKDINIGTLKAGETYSTFYEVKVDDLKDTETEKTITTNIKAYIQDTEAKNYSITNKINQSDAQIFLDAKLDNGENRWNYGVKLTGQSNQEVTVKIKLPKEFTFQYLLYKTDLYKAPIDYISVSNENVLTATLKIDNENMYYFEGVMDTTNNNTDASFSELTSIASVTVNNNTYISNENRVDIFYKNASISMSSPTEGEEVKYGDEIEYDITVKNTGATNLNNNTSSIAVNITDFLPENVTPVSLNYETYEEKSVKSDNNTTSIVFNKKEVSEDISNIKSDESGNKLANVDIFCTIPYQKSISVKIIGRAGLVYEKTKIENSATITSTETLIENGNTINKSVINPKTSNKIAHIITVYEQGESDNPVEPETPTNPTTPVTPKNDEQTINTTSEKYGISGLAWIDKNEDGQRQTTEETFQGMNVLLLDAKDTNSIKAQTQTGNGGTYNFNNLDAGSYVVLFEYDNKNYTITTYQKSGGSDVTNSDAVEKETTIQGNKTTVGATDLIYLNASISNIDIGLVQNKICDLRLDKYITKIQVQTSKQTTETSYDREKLAKVEIKSKEINGAKVTIDYEIVITNEGELTATVGNVIDYLPTELSLATNSSANWSFQKDGSIVNTSTANQKIDPGQSVTLKLTAIKLMNGNETGTVTNSAEIGSITTDKGIKDTDSTPSNQNESEDDFSKADAIISVSTGIYVYISIATTVIILIGLLVFLILKKKNIKINKKIFNRIAILITFLLLIIANTGNAIASYAPYTANFSFDGGVDGTTFNGGQGWCLDHGAPNQDKDPPYHTGYTLSSESVSVLSRTITSVGDIDFYRTDGNTINMYSSGSSFVYGPFNVYCNNNNGYSIVVRSGNGSRIDGWSEYGSNSSFYISIPKEKCKDGISSISATNSSLVTVTYYEDLKVYAVYSPDYGGQRVGTDIYTSDTYYGQEWSSKTVTWTSFNGSLEVTKVDNDNTSLKLKNVQIQISGNGYSATKTTDDSGKVLFDNIPTGYYNVNEILNNNYGYTKLESGGVYVSGGMYKQYDLKNIRDTGNLLIYKNDYDSKKALKGMSFKVLDSDGNYIVAIDKQNNSQSNVTSLVNLGNLGKTQNKDLATVFTTGDNGIVEIKNILTGTYYIEEVDVGKEYYGYDLDKDYVFWETSAGNGDGLIGNITVPRQTSWETDSTSQDSQTSSTSSNITMKNRRKYVKISGYAWEDIDWADGKEQEGNGLYKATNQDVNDKLMGNVIVRIRDDQGKLVEVKDKNDNKITEESTENGTGAYLFKDVLIDKLENYYIEFEYNGMCYRSVACKLDYKNGSKADEGSNRTDFDNSYAQIAKNESENISGSNTYGLSYSSGSYSSKIIYGNSNSLKYGYTNQKYPIQGTYQQYLIKATTYNAYNGYFNKIRNKIDIRANGEEEVKNVNLGVLERQQPDSNLQKDLQNVKVKINGYEHTYNYADRFNSEDVYKNGSNMQIKFTNERGGKQTYTREIYKSDLEYDANSKSNNIEIYATYHIQVVNTSTSIKMSYDIADYYDERYTVSDYGIELDSNENPTNESGLTESYNINDSNGYKKIVIESSTKIDPFDKQNLYIQFKLNNTESNYAVANAIINEGIKIDNVAEINRYRSFYNDANSNSYAGIDTDSAPENVTPGVIGTYEDDTDSAPPLEITPGEERTTKGTVFVDDVVTSGSGNIRQGSGIYETDEATVGGVDVTLSPKRYVTDSGEGITYKTTTVSTDRGSDGKYIEKKYGIQMYVDNKDGNGSNLYTDETKRIKAHAEITYKAVEYNEIEKSTYITTQEMQNGDYFIFKIVPEQYVTTYTWGDNTYADSNGNHTITVQDYKGTIFNQDIHGYAGIASDQEIYSLKWAIGNDQTTRYQDAKDNYEDDRNKPNGSRKQIDQEMSYIYEGTQETGYQLQKMDSTTPILDLGIEKSESDLSGKDNQTDEKFNYSYVVSNVDFGVIERAKQELTTDKQIKHVRLTIDNAQVVIDTAVNIDSNGNVTFSNPSTYFAYIPKDNEHIKGQYKIEMDNEIIQNARLQIWYSLKVENLSEVDYDDRGYYLYGNIPSGDTGKLSSVIKIQPTKVFDYLDKEIAKDSDANPQNWSEYTDVSATNSYQTEATLEERSKATITTDENGKTTIHDPSIMEYDSGQPVEYDETIIDDGSGNSEVTKTRKDTNKEEHENKNEKAYDVWQDKLYTQRYYNLLTKRVYYNDNGKVVTNDVKDNMKDGEFYQNLLPKINGITTTNSESVIFETSKTLTSTDEIYLENGFEVAKIDKSAFKTDNNSMVVKGHSLIISKDAITGKEDLIDAAQPLTVIPPTGEEYKYIPIITLAISCLGILVSGIILIKKKVIG